MKPLAIVILVCVCLTTIAILTVGWKWTLAGAGVIVMTFYILAGMITKDDDEMRGGK